jgi:hypothetical protein
MKTPSRQCVLFLAPVLFALLVCHPVEAQVVTGGLAPGLPSASAASYFYVSKPGELTMQVNVWGYVHNPGRYEVPTSTDLIQLLSFAGGPIQDAKLDEVKVTRFLKRDTGISRGEFFVNLEDLSKVDQAKLVLYPGDTIYMSHTSWVNLRDIFTVVSTVAIVASALSQIYIASMYRR